MKNIEHLADFLGGEKRRRWNEFHKTRHMRCWDCIKVIDDLAETYGFHWNKEKQEYDEETSFQIEPSTEEDEPIEASPSAMSEAMKKCAGKYIPKVGNKAEEKQ